MQMSELVSAMHMFIYIYMYIYSQEAYICCELSDKGVGHIYIVET